VNGGLNNLIVRRREKEIVVPVVEV